MSKEILEEITLHISNSSQGSQSVLTLPIQKPFYFNLGLIKPSKQKCN